ncbi:hypothetical protein [Microbacterium paraoxydans]|uniref:arsenate reductase/protein-tyrosine-phosphatase family protein n=1 Tax=Microbacterium paraoxydans TaxID=199592 RepID=UPI0009E68F66|nr:hypothetical protein [Microbacterium paraoxydans]
MLESGSAVPTRHRGEHVAHRLIFVCEANICRSPLMAQVLRASAEEQLWDITSAGIRVGPGDRPMCEAAVEVARAVGAGAGADDHRSSAVDADRIRTADLILTASRAERSFISQLVPQARSKAFTLREALHLGAAVFGEENASALLDDERAADGLAAYAAALHGRRGFVAPPKTRRTLLGRRRSNPFDIPDAHHDAARAHRAMLERTALEASALYRQVSAFLVPPTPDLLSR